ncbi:galactonate dehydratase [Halohasta litorea]|uniref:Galactonate dehydratase n=1 Tax=Halohasta litorea TaxID=869891 RepID=A0ABD6D6S4_9EURY|nr:galactonate dehydratase [Halohasta litorea]
MEITGYELFAVPPRWLFLKLETDTGICGWGEPIVEGHTKTTRAAVEEILDNYLIGKDPLEIERHWQAMYRGRHFRGGPILMSAIGGIDQALWDIKGKRYDAPVYELLGGRARDRIRTYQWIGGDTPEEIADAAEAAVDNGYKTLKLSVSQFRRIDSPAAVTHARDRLAAVRERVGDGIDVGVDFRGRVTKSMAPSLAEKLAPLDPMFYEEPVLSEHADSLGDIAAHTTVPLAIGQRLYSRWDVAPLIEDRAVDVLQPSPSHAGGISEVRKIATSAEAADILVSLHCPLGPISLAACLQLDMAIPNAIVQAQSLDLHQPQENDLLAYLDDPTVFGFADGYLTAPDAPGLGIEVDESVVREQAQSDINWQNPIWYHDDGSIAEW